MLFVFMVRKLKFSESGDSVYRGDHF